LNSDGFGADASVMEVELTAVASPIKTMLSGVSKLVFVTLMVRAGIAGGLWREQCADRAVGIFCERVRQAAVVALLLTAEFETAVNALRSSGALPSFSRPWSRAKSTGFPGGRA